MTHSESYYSTRCARIALGCLDCNSSFSEFSIDGCNICIHYPNSSLSLDLNYFVFYIVESTVFFISLNDEVIIQVPILFTNPCWQNHYSVYYESVSTFGKRRIASSLS